MKTKIKEILIFFITLFILIYVPIIRNITIMIFAFLITLTTIRFNLLQSEKINIYFIREIGQNVIRKYKLTNKNWVSVLFMTMDTNMARLNANDDLSIVRCIDKYEFRINMKANYWYEKISINIKDFFILYRTIKGLSNITEVKIPVMKETILAFKELIMYESKIK